MLKNCAVCGKEFEPFYPKIRYCSNKCKKKGRKKSCKFCGIKFNDKGYFNNRKYCPKCFDIIRYTKNLLNRTKYCIVCGNEINFTSTKFKYCSEKCCKQHHYDKKFERDITRKINSSISRGMYHSLNGNKKGLHWEDLVGYTLEDLKKHLEKQFTEGMSWSNYGINGWHIDHRIVKSSFKNITSYDCKEFKKCWDLENLKPMWGIQNIRKGNRYSEPTLKQLGIIN